MTLINVQFCLSVKNLEGISVEETPQMVLHSPAISFIGGPGKQRMLWKLGSSPGSAIVGYLGVLWLLLRIHCDYDIIGIKML